MSEGFDTRVHHRSPKTGRVEKTTPYRMHCTKDQGTWFVRDGVHYHPNGEVKYDPKLDVAGKAPAVEAKEETAPAPQKAKSEKKGQ